MNYFNYFTEIEETFVRRRGRNLFLSPLDWALMEAWKEKEIPLRIILQGINNVFDTAEKNPQRARNIKSLTYCRDEVESLFNDWRGSQVGKNIEPEEESERTKAAREPSIFVESAVETHLAEVSAALKKVIPKYAGEIRQTIESVMSGIENCQDEAETDAQDLEQNLERWEKLIDLALLNHLDKTIIAEYRNEIDNDLSKHRSTMEADVYQTTYDMMLLKRLREHAEIPRLSLFYL